MTDSRVESTTDDASPDATRTGAASAQVLPAPNPQFTVGGSGSGPVPVLQSDAERAEARAAISSSSNQATVQGAGDGGVLDTLEDIFSEGGETLGDVLDRAAGEALDVIEGALGGAEAGADAGSRAAAQDFRATDLVLAGLVLLLIFNS